MSLFYEAEKNLSLAKASYTTGNYLDALSYNSKALAYYPSADRIPQNELLTYLDVLTLQQSLLLLLNKTHEYLALNEEVKHVIYLLFDSKSDFYYATKLLDTCEALARHHYLSEAHFYMNQGLTLLHKCFGECPYYDFMKTYYNALTSFYSEDYYTCTESSLLANSYWYNETYEDCLIPLPFDESYGASFLENARPQVDRLGILNILLFCNAQAKLFNPNESIRILEEGLQNEWFDITLLPSAEITLAQLYAIANRRDLALPLYQKYKNGNYAQHPDLVTALVSLAYMLEIDHVSFSDTLLTDLHCFSHDMLVSLRYNHAYSLAFSGKKEAALPHFSALGEHGYSMTCAILAEQNRFSEIANITQPVCEYFYRQINQIIAHYNEKLAYNHLTKLQHHIDLTLGAFCHPMLSAADAYNFLLNTKYVALETSYLLHEKKAHEHQCAFEREIISSQQIMSKLTEHTILFEYTKLRTLDTIFYGVFIVSNSSVSFVLLADVNTIDPLLEEWYRATKDSALADGEAAFSSLARLQATQTKLRKYLYLPIKDYVSSDRIKRLLIAPAGALVAFPFSQLSCSSKKVLGDAYVISYLNTGKELLFSDVSVLTSQKFHNNCNAFVIGNPAPVSFDNLPLAESEADMISYFLQTKPYKKEDASLSNTLSALQTEPAFIHIAAHGIYTSLPTDTPDVNWDALYEAMTGSGILLSNDTLLSCAQISRLDLSHTRLAVLSCCYSGKAAYLSTEGAYGLRRALRTAGCSSIILNLWEVDDTVSFLWMKAFYEAFTFSRLSIEDAFIFAVSTIKNYEKNGMRPYENPYYWAGFILL